MIRPESQGNWQNFIGSSTRQNQIFKRRNNFMNSPVSQSLGEGILKITMNSPQNRNALSKTMMEDLQEALDMAAADDAVRVIILAANGPAFCAGHDMKEITDARQMDDGGRAYYQDMLSACSILMQSIVNHRCPVIADIRATASAAGCQMVASCDLAISCDDVRFCTPGVNIGLFCSTPMVALSRNISPKHAMEMLLCGDMITAQRAEKIGLVNKVVERSGIDQAIGSMAQKISSKSTMTVRLGKAAFYAQAEMDLAQAYDYASSVMVENLLKNDASEGISAFIEKRDPKWSDS
jgi:enoyl-CoA hydratase/carnithine racemase